MKNRLYDDVCYISIKFTITHSLLSTFETNKIDDRLIDKNSEIRVQIKIEDRCVRNIIIQYVYSKLDQQ